MRLHNLAYTHIFQQWIEFVDKHNSSVTISILQFCNNVNGHNPSHLSNGKEMGWKYL